MKKTKHLDDNQIIAALIDENGLNGLLRRHLSECPTCRGQKEQLQAGLAQFGKISRDSIPLTYRRPELIDNRARGISRNWKFAPALAFIAAAVLLAFFLTPIAVDKDKIFTRKVVYQEMLRDQKFMAEVKTLEENPLPGFYVDISGPDEAKPNAATPGPGAKNNVKPTPEKNGSRNA